MPTNSQDYVWDYLIPENNDRTKKLVSILKPIFLKNERVLDVNCGFSPLSSYLISKLNNFVTGFDINPMAISYCKSKYESKHSVFLLADDKDYISNDFFDVIIHLGIAPGEHPAESSTEKATSTKLILKHQPRLVIIEAALNYESSYLELKSFLESLTFYRKVLDTEYQFNITKKCKNSFGGIASKRKLSVFEKTVVPFSLNSSSIADLLIDTVPAAQGQSIENFNLGFGFIYYSLVRALRPSNVVAFGSLKGFAPICFALGLKDNNHGKLSFIDAAYSDTKEGKDVASGGEGFWKIKKQVKQQFDKFGVTNIITLFVQKTSEYFDFLRQNGLPLIDLLYIDANHTYDGFKYDFEAFSPLLSESGTIVFHDALVDENNNGYTFGVKKYYEEVILKNGVFESFRLPLWPGLVILQKSPIKQNQLQVLKTELQEKEHQLLKIHASKLWKIFTIYKKVISLPKIIYKKTVYSPFIKYSSSLPVSDWEKYKTLRLSALKESPQAFADTLESESLLPDSEWQNRLQSYLNKNGWMVFASYKNELVGMLGAVQNETDLSTNTATGCQFYILPKFRGIGISDKLISELLKLLKTSEISRCNLFVSNTQTRAIQSYFKNSFIITKKDSMFFSDGTLHTGYFMSKSLK
ncbi:MAG: GNAT family N-acetyltransferase [Candidatus Shapirobacteria bacterium]